MIRNGYPKKIFNRRLARMRQRNLGTDVKITEEKPNRIILPYMGPITTRLSQFLRRSLNCEFGYLTGLKIGQTICNHKTKPKRIDCGVYKIPCFSPCPSKYIGETCRDFLERLSDHKRDVRTNKTDSSALASHIK